MAGQWAADPYGRAELRYWDGERWTDHISNNGVSGIDAPDPGGFQPPGGVSSPPPVAMHPGVPVAGFAGYGVAPGTPAPAGYGAPVVKTSGKLIAAGVMTLVEAGILLLMGLWLFSLSNSDVGGFVDDVSGGAITFIAFLVLLMGGALLAAGVGSCKGLNWGRMMVIVLHGIGLAFLVIGLLGGGNDEPTSTDYSFDSYGYTTSDTSTSDTSPGDLVVPLAWSGTIIFLAWTGKTREQLLAAAATPAPYQPPYQPPLA